MVVAVSILALAGIAGVRVSLGESSGSGERFHGGDAATTAGSYASGDRGRSPVCRDARRGLRWYRDAISRYRREVGTGEVPRTSSPARLSCPVVRRAATFYRAKAIEWLARARAYRREWNWRLWLPSKWVRIGICETGLRWDWNSGRFQGAFGFYWGTWDDYRPAGYPAEAYLASPRQQYDVALRVRDGVPGKLPRNGYGAWGCGGA